MNCVIFSKDRAMQLECLLRSLYENCDIFDKVTVIYKTKFYESYEILKSIYPQVNWVSEYLFKDDLFDNIGYTKCCLLVDDDIIYKKVDVVEIEEAFQDNCDIFSLRLGENIEKESHFDVKSSVDGNIFYAKHIRRVKDEWFTNPNQLEMRLAKHVDDLSMCWFDDSKLIGIPNNRVSVTSGCAHMKGDTEELDNLFLMGYRIDYKQMGLNYHNVHKHEQYILTL